MDEPKLITRNFPGEDNQKANIIYSYDSIRTTKTDNIMLPVKHKLIQQLISR